MTKQYAQDREMSYEEAAYWCQIESEQCTCLWDEVGGKPIPDGCVWHSRAAREQEELIWHANAAREQEEVSQPPARQLAAAGARRTEGWQP